MKNIYIVPQGNMSSGEYHSHICNLPITWSGEPGLKVENNRVIIDGTIEGFEPIGTVDENAPVPAVRVTEVSKRQATQALILAGKDESVAEALAAIPGIEGKLARAEWEQSKVVERNRPLVLQMGAALAMTSEELDALFTLAATL